MIYSTVLWLERGIYVLEGRAVIVLAFEPDGHWSDSERDRFWAKMPVVHELMMLFNKSSTLTRNKVL